MWNGKGWLIFRGFILLLLLEYTMINKAVGYGGFRSYGECPYPTQKMGKELQNTNQMWSSTRREADRISPLDNYNHYHTIYQKDHTENTQPKDYHPLHVPRGANSSINFGGSSIGQPYDKKQADLAGQPSYRKGFSLLKTGTQHWKTSYQSSICQPAQDSKLNKSSQVRRCESSGKTLKTEQQIAKANSYKNRPYINNAKMGTTEYKFSFGEKIGYDPKELLNAGSKKQPIIDNPLKYGTNQLWSQIPGYLGFKPAQLPFSQLKSKIQSRDGYKRGDNKLLLSQNYHVNIPGYGGYRPKVEVGSTLPRQSCFQFRKT